MQITEAAINELRRLATESQKEPRVRILVAGGGCSGVKIDMDFTKWPADEEFDTVTDFNGVEVIIDVKSAAYLQDAQLDFGGSLLDRGFKWSVPNKGGCGCGLSFEV